MPGLEPACKDGRKDAHVDGPKDRRVDACKDSGDAPRAAARRGGAVVIVLANHKGGVTKTTSTANLGAMLAERGRRVLVVDCDPQANLSEAFGWSENLVGERLEDLLANPDASARYRPPVALLPDLEPLSAWRELLRIIPCTDALADVAADLPSAVGDGYESQLKLVLDAQRPAFDHILLDTPPGLGNLSGMAILAADELLIPALAADLDVRGAGKLYDLVESQVPDLRILAVLIAASERRWRVTRDATARMDADDMRVLPFHIPRAVRVASAPRYRAPTAVLEPDSLVTQAYRRLANHILEERRP
ncbi:MAG: ParA family protein [Solirubrobacteraceae bacterium]